MQLIFELSMPNRGSWNGGWSGEKNLYAIIKSFNTKKAIAKAQKMLDTGSYYYSWGDGWGASISVRKLERGEARAIRKRSKGFCGYDWMVKSILDRNCILADHEIVPEVGLT